MHEAIAPQAYIGSGSRHHASDHLKVRSVGTLGARELLWIVRHRPFGIDTSFVAQLHDRVEPVRAEILAGAVMPKAFGADTEHRDPDAQRRAELILGPQPI